MYKSKARKEKDLKYNQWADEFESLANEILEKFYRTYPLECTKAIIREIPQYGNLTWLHLAVMAEAKLFIAQRAVQNVLGSIWFVQKFNKVFFEKNDLISIRYGYIDHRIGNTKIICTTFMLWYSGFLPYHNEMVEVNDDMQFKEV